MTQAETRYAIDPATAKGLDTAGLREHFHVGGLFKPGEIKLVYSHYDRLLLGSVVPNGKPLVLDNVPETGTPSILDRREMGVLNLGAVAEVLVDTGRAVGDKVDLIRILSQLHDRQLVFRRLSEEERCEEMWTERI